MLAVLDVWFIVKHGMQHLVDFVESVVIVVVVVVVIIIVVVVVVIVSVDVVVELNFNVL